MPEGFSQSPTRPAVSGRASTYADSRLPVLDTAESAIPSSRYTLSSFPGDERSLPAVGQFLGYVFARAASVRADERGRYAPRESGRSGVLTVQATGRQVDAYSWTAARITNGIPISETGTAAAVAVAEWENRRACSELSP